MKKVINPSVLIIGESKPGRKKTIDRTDCTMSPLCQRSSAMNHEDGERRTIIISYLRWPFAPYRWMNQALTPRTIPALSLIHI